MGFLGKLFFFGLIVLILWISLTVSIYILGALVAIFVVILGVFWLGYAISRIIRYFR